MIMIGETYLFLHQVSIERGPLLQDGIKNGFFFLCVCVCGVWVCVCVCQACRSLLLHWSSLWSDKSQALNTLVIISGLTRRIICLSARPLSLRCMAFSLVPRKEFKCRYLPFPWPPSLVRFNLHWSCWWRKKMRSTKISLGIWSTKRGLVFVPLP